MKTERPTRPFAALAPNSGTPVTSASYAPHQSPLPWVNILTIWPWLMREQGDRQRA
jgi:hypothetical protein